MSNNKNKEEKNKVEQPKPIITEAKPASSEEVKGETPDLVEGAPIPLTPFKFGVKASKEGSEWVEALQDPSRYIISAKLSGLAESDPEALVYCSDIPEGTAGKTKETAITAKAMFTLYTDGPDALLRSDFQARIQEVFLKLFQDSILVNAVVTMTVFAPTGGMIPLTLGFTNPMVAYGKVPAESEKLLNVAVAHLSKALEKKVTGGIIVPDTQIKMPKKGDLILPG